jgi:hypothetical protein
VQQGWLLLYALHSAKSDNGSGSGGRMIERTEKGKKVLNKDEKK